MTQVKAPEGYYGHIFNDELFITHDPMKKIADNAPLGVDEVKQIVGDIDDAKTIEILELRPTVVEFEEAAAWVSGNSEILGKAGRPLTGDGAQIVDILTADEDEEPARPH